MHLYYLTDATEKGSERIGAIDDFSECCVSFRGIQRVSSILMTRIEKWVRHPNLRRAHSQAGKAK